MCPLERCRGNKDDRDREERGFPPIMNGVNAIKTDVAYHFIVTSLEREKYNKKESRTV